jgi:HlyD family secretion protein
MADSPPDPRGQFADLPRHREDPACQSPARAGNPAEPSGDSADPAGPPAAEQTAWLPVPPTVGLPARSRLGRPQRLLLGLVAASVLVAAGGLIGAAWVRSPAEVAAQAAPPPPTLLTVPVARQVVSQTLVARGTVSAAQQVQDTPAAEAGAQRLVITGIERPAGSAVTDGNVLVTVSGRPLIALAGPFPAYRDLTPGESGPDVTELQQALAGVGLPTGADPAGFYGPGTKAAVAELYARAGFTALNSGASAAQLQAVAADQAAVADGGPAGKAAAGRLAADQSAAAAATAAAAAMADHSGPMVPISEVVFVGSFPATMVAVSGSVGSIVSAPLVTIDSGRPGITAQLDPSDKPDLRTGEAVAAYDATTGWRDTGTVTGVAPVSSGAVAGSGAGAAAPGSGASPGGAGPAGGTGPFVPVSISLAGQVPPAEIGEDVQLTVTYAASAGPVLAVPEAAIRTGADGRTYVLKVTGSGRQQRVPVTAGISGAGLVAVTPAAGSAGLAAGDKVVTGS